ncbi:MAG: 50S ribosomal protein L16 [Patescibacteria group bacterium]|nr:50S ribosomal protein L16 [Patescibacteria group bacterium]MDD5715368.1 50S ribosomal protein L16 [Patescibacteria group bacterium]
MLLPKKVKHRKWQKGIVRGRATSRSKLSFGSFGLKALSASWVSSRQIEAARRAMTHFVHKGGKIWIRIFPDKPITSHGSEVPMGGGKGAVDHYVYVVKPGTVLFEIDGVALDKAKEAFRRASHKLPVRTKFISREGI